MLHCSMCDVLTLSALFSTIAVGVLLFGYGISVLKGG